MKLRLRLLLEWSVIAFLATAAVLAALFWRGTESFDNLFYDQLSELARPAADKDILIVAIDDPSLAALGKWPWPRQKHAELIARLQTAQPRSILLDILLSEPSLPEQDAALAAAMTQGVPVYLPVHFDTPGMNGHAFDTLPPIAPLQKAAAGLGHVNVEFDSDGRVRRAALCFQVESAEPRWPHIVERVARGNGPATTAYGRQQDCGATVLIPYAKRGSIAQISYADLLQGNVPSALIKGRDVIIGATAAGLGDNYPVPYGDGGLLSGAEIMANMLSALRHDNFVRPVPFWASILLSLAPMWLLLIGFLRWRPRIALAMSVAAVFALLLGSGLGLSARYWFAPGSALLGLFLVYPWWGWRRLQAMSEFMQTELGDMEREGEMLPALPARSGPGDMVGRQSEALAGAIDHMRDLRRFVSDTLDHMPDQLLVTDLGGIVTLTNDGLDAMLGRDVTNMAFSNVLDLIVQPQYRRQVDAYLEKARVTLSEKGDADGHFIRFTSPQDFTFVMRTADIRSDAEQLRGHIHYLTDITDLARAEEDREVALQLLSHDMRAPQSAIIAMLPEIGDAATGVRIERHARRTIQLAQDFVEIARMGEGEFEGTDVLLPDMARDIADSFWPLAREREIVIAVDDQSDDAFVFAEPDGLSRALSNLVDNAIKHSPDGAHIHISVERLADTPHQIALIVEDEGEGIDPELSPRLFERFATRDSGRGRVKGIGLGLTFVRAVADRHQGRVYAENRIEGGARFVMILPEAPEPAEDI